MSSWKKYLHSIRKREIDIVIDYLKNKKLDSCIEFGAGDGYQTMLLSEKFDYYVSSDLNHQRLDSQYFVDSVIYKKIDADNIENKMFDKKFDVVFSSNMLEHLSKPDIFLKDTIIFLKDDGYAIHVVPSRMIKISYISMHFLYLIKLFIDRILNFKKNKKLFGGFSDNNKNNINSVDTKDVKKISKLKRVLLPQVHGNYDGHLKEFISYGRESWENKFKQAGYLVVEHIKGPVFSGYGFGLGFIRKFFESIGLYSEHIFILKKKITLDNNKKNIAVITPKNKGEYLTNTIIDGFLQIQKNNNINLFIPESYEYYDDLEFNKLPRNLFIEYAKQSDLIFFCRLDNGQTDYEMFNLINKPEKTIFIDGSELRGNCRLNFDIQKSILDGVYIGYGDIEKNILNKCPMYFRREKPYINGILPLPYGIEDRYLSFYKKDLKKDIDFVCIFGQNFYSPMRKHAEDILKDYCEKNNFSCVIKTTKGFDMSDNSKNKGRDDFYKILARSKVGISISGGGFDTARFWETLANNCILLTEKIDIYNPDDKSLDYERVYQFNNLFDFKYQLEKLGDYLINEYKQDVLYEEYNKILETHSTKKRVMYILKEAQKKGLIDFELV